jgi:tetratricopeptide (TPR) repeat protein
MLRHHIFFDTLSRLQDSDASRGSTLAGLLVLRQVDLALDPSNATVGRARTGTKGARDSIAKVSERDPIREILTRILDLVEHGAGSSEPVGRELMSFGQALDLDAKWPLAVDVFQTVARDFSGPANTSLVIDACIALGSAARNAGQWETSAHAYAEAQYLADTIGDRASSLTVEVGIAGTHMARGNLPAAEAALDEVLRESETEELQGVQALALHARASVAHSRGNYQEAIQYAYRSLELTTNGSARDRILADIAAAYAGLGMRETARDAYSIVAVTSPHQWVRWQSTLNLMDLAIEEGDETRFDHYLRQVESAALDPRLHGYFLFFRGLGMRRFGREGADDQLRAAQEFAATHQLHQIEFEIDQALVQTETAPLPPLPTAVKPSIGADSVALTRIAEALSHLREQATS